jgi:hypothetical protein
MKYSYKILIFILLVVVIILFNNYSKGLNMSGFQNYYSDVKWSPDLLKRFNLYQQTVFLYSTQFDLDILQKQAKPDEAEHLLATGFWPWPDDLKQEYIDKVWSNPIIKFSPQASLNYAMRRYNQNAARELLAWNSKEGHFLLYGADLGVTEGLPNNLHNTLKCTTDSHGNSVMEKKVFLGPDYWNGYFNINKTIIKPEDIPKEMKGFSFVKSACDPCVALNYPPDYSCPFKLNVKVDDQISRQWKQLWGL